MNELERQGLIQAFEYTHELAWKIMQDYFLFQGNAEIRGSKDATRMAFQMNLIEDGDNWMEMILQRNLTSHTHNEEVSAEIYRNIITEFYALFLDFQAVMDKLAEKEEGY